MTPTPRLCSAPPDQQRPSRKARQMRRKIPRLPFRRHPEGASIEDRRNIEDSIRQELQSSKIARMTIKQEDQWQESSCLLNGLALALRQEHARYMPAERQRNLRDHGTGHLAGRRLRTGHAADLAVSGNPFAT